MKNTEGGAVMRSMLLVLALLLLAAGAMAEEVIKPKSDQALHFRIEVGLVKTKTVVGWFDESKGTGKGIDSVVLDLDGDGTPETRRVLPTHKMPPDYPYPEYVQMVIDLRHEGVHWNITYQDIHRYMEEGFDRPKQRFFSGWQITKGTAIASFSGGEPRFYATAEEAAKAEPMRYGRDVTIEISAGTRGPGALLNVSVKDATGCSLGSMYTDTGPRKPRIRIVQEEKEKLTATAEYG
jgi:hypothetical protein